MTYFCLKIIKLSFADHCVKQHDTMEYRGRQNSKLSGEAMASKALKKTNTKLKFLYRPSRYFELLPLEGYHIKCAVATFRL